MEILNRHIGDCPGPTIGAAKRSGMAYANQTPILEGSEKSCISGNALQGRLHFIAAPQMVYLARAYVCAP